MSTSKQGVRGATQRYFQMYVENFNQCRIVLPKWETTLLKKFQKRNYVGKSIGLIDGVIEEMCRLAAELDLGEL